MENILMLGTDNKELVSVIVPIYKVEKYLNECVESIINQTYKNLEIILVDDGSPDSCPQICDDYALKDSRIKVIHKKNGGLSDARNCGIKAADGEWIAFVDGDDLIHYRYIEILLTIALKLNAQIMCSDIHSFYDGEAISPNSVLSKLKIKKYSNKSYLKEMFKDGHCRYTIAWNKIYKKDLFDNIKYPVGLIHEDEATTYKLIYAAKTIGVINLSLNYYRQRKDSIMSTRKFENSTLIMERINKEKEEFLLKNYPSNILLMNNAYNEYYNFIQRFEHHLFIDKVHYYETYMKLKKFWMYFIYMKFVRIIKIFIYHNKIKKYLES